jgi:hypothetical protein
VRVSRFFGLNQVQAELDFIDVDTASDTRLFVDPYAIQIKDNDFSIRSADQIRSYFSEVLSALRRRDIDRARYLTSYLTEPRDTFLGFSRGEPHGRGVGRYQADQILTALQTSRAFQTGILSDLAEAELFVEGIARDKISDLTTNIIRGSLIDYTHAECELHGIRLEREVASAPIWNEHTLMWEQRYVRLPIVEQQPVLLVPKYFVRWKLSIDSQEFYNHYMVEFLREENLNGMTQLVRFFRKSGEPYVLKKDVKALHPFLKDSLATFVRDHPDILERYKTLKGAKGALHNEDFDQEFNEADFAAALRAALTRIPPGMANASRYHSFMYGVLTFLFYPDLINPVKEHEINQGRKRVDIKFTNADEAGFFRRMAELPQTRSVNVFFECKNYSRDLGNPELDQLIGRLSPIRGKLGFILCRALEDEALMLERCRDAVRSDHGFVIVLTDEIVDELLGLVEARQRHRISERLHIEFARLTD